MVASNLEVESILQQVRSWTAESRIALARRVLESVEVETKNVTAGFKGKSTEQVLGLWSPGTSAPTDQECDEILAEELSRKHAS